MMWTFVLLFAAAALGLTLIKRLATWPALKIQSSVLPPKTVATFSSAGSSRRVDSLRLVRMTGGAAVVLTSTVRGAFCWTVAGGAAWALTANRTLAAMSREVFIGRLQ